MKKEKILGSWNSVIFINLFDFSGLIMLIGMTGKTLQKSSYSTFTYWRLWVLQDAEGTISLRDSYGIWTFWVSIHLMTKLYEEFSQLKLIGILRYFGFWLVCQILKLFWFASFWFWCLISAQFEAGCFSTNAFYDIVRTSGKFDSRNHWNNVLFYTFFDEKIFLLSTC